MIRLSELTKAQKELLIVMNDKDSVINEAFEVSSHTFTLSHRGNDGKVQRVTVKRLESLELLNRVHTAYYGNNDYYQYTISYKGRKLLEDGTV